MSVETCRETCCNSCELTRDCGKDNHCQRVKDGNCGRYGWPCIAYKAKGAVIDLREHEQVK